MHGCLPRRPAGPQMSPRMPLEEMALRRESLLWSNYISGRERGWGVGVSLLEAGTRPDAKNATC